MRYRPDEEVAPLEQVQVDDRVPVGQLPGNQESQRDDRDDGCDDDLGRGKPVLVVAVVH